MVTKDGKGDAKEGIVDVESLRTTTTSERGLVIEREIQVEVKSSERQEGDKSGQRRSWLQFMT